MEQLKVWEPRLVTECFQRTGKAPIGTRWTEMDKGDHRNPIVRCRLVVQETKYRSMIDPEDLSATFAATPAIEAIRFLFSCLVTWISVAGDELVVRHLDISRAHPHCPMRRILYVKPPPEAGFPEGYCALLLNTLYGCRDASQNFELVTTDIMVAKLSFLEGAHHPCLYWHEIQHVAVVRHGDDFFCLGARSHTLRMVCEGTW